MILYRVCERPAGFLKRYRVNRVEGLWTAAAAAAAELTMTTDPLRLHGAEETGRKRLQDHSQCYWVYSIPPEPSASFSTVMDFTSSSTQRTSDATCSASAS